jgi:hypothetical protein
MKSLSFEDWLMDYYCSNDPDDKHSLDDDIPDAYADWISNIDIDTLIKLGDLYGKEKYKQGHDAFLNNL